MVNTEVEHWEIRAPLDYEGPNYTAGELKSDLGSFLKTQTGATYHAYDDWEFQYFCCVLPKETALLFCLQHPKYNGSFKVGKT